MDDWAMKRSATYGATQAADEVHVIFNNNNSADFAPRAAEHFRKLLGQELPPERSSATAVARKDPPKTWF